jgi:hypothetical protein
MPKKPENYGKLWSYEQVEVLKKLIDRNTHTPVITL